MSVVSCFYHNHTALHRTASVRLGLTNGSSLFSGSFRRMSAGRRQSLPILHSGTMFRTGIMQLMNHTLEQLPEGERLSSILEKFSDVCKHTGCAYWISATTFQIISKVLGESEEEDSSRISDHRSPSMTRPHEAVYRPPSANEGLPLSNSTPRSPRTASRGSIHRNRKHSQIEEIVRMPNFVHSY